MAAPSLRGLVQTPALALRLISGTDRALDRPLRWVHSTDLADPTPFLADDLALLTTGGQFDGQLTASAYVDRLVERGVAGLGFGTGVKRPELPEGLVAACERAALPLFEVPYATPFIAVARAHAEAVAAEAFARRSWALDTQRALAVAALRPHGLVAIIAELGRRLDAWVAMFDASGALTLEHPPGGISGAAHEDLAAQVDDMLARGTETGRSIAVDGQSLQLFTLGRTRGLRGVIAVAAPSLDSEARAVVTSVIAMAGLALEQSVELEDSRRRLHTQLLESLLADDDTLAQRVLGTLPAAPVIVAVAPDAVPGALEEWWERRRSERGSRAFLAVTDAGVVLCLSGSDGALIDEAAARFGIRIGVSEPVDYSSFSRAHGQALSALRRGSGGVVRFSDAAASGMFATLRTEDAALYAQSRLAPLRKVGPGLEHALRVWLEHDAHYESAAAALGIHRHTLRSRVTQAAGLLHLDLNSFPARAELWAALQTAR